MTAGLYGVHDDALYKSTAFAFAFAFSAPLTLRLRRSTRPPPNPNPGSGPGEGGEHKLPPREIFSAYAPGLTRSYFLSGDNQPTCSTCGHPLTVRHILLDCVDLQDVRRRHFSVTCVRDPFETVDNRVVIDFIKDIRFYSLL